MNVTLYSLLTALVVSGIFSLLLVLLSFQTTWIMKLGLWPLCVLLLLAGLRMWLPVEMPFARPVELELENGSAWLSRPLWGELSLGEGLAFLWLLGILLLLGRLFAGWKTHQKQMEAWEEAPEEERDSYYEMLLRTYRAIRTTEPGKAAEEGRKPWPRFYRHRVIQRFRLGLDFGLMGNKGRKAGRALALAALFAFVCSYAVVFQPEPWRENSIIKRKTKALPAFRQGLCFQCLTRCIDLQVNPLVL